MSHLVVSISRRVLREESCCNLGFYLVPVIVAIFVAILLGYFDKKWLLYQILIFLPMSLEMLHTAIPSIRLRFLSEESFVLLDKIRDFRHFIRDAYDYELLEVELREIQNKIESFYSVLEKDVLEFRQFV